MSLCLICGADGRKRCNLQDHMTWARQEEKNRIVNYLRDNAELHQATDGYTAIMAEAQALENGS